MIKKYISLLEIVPAIMDNVTKVKDFATNVEDIYRLCNPDAYRSWYGDRIKIPLNAEIDTCECALIYIQKPNSDNPLGGDNKCYNIPHILELEYLKQDNNTYTTSEMDMLYKMSVMLLLAYLASLPLRNTTLLRDIQAYLTSNRLFNQHIYELDVDENPSQVKITIDDIYNNHILAKQLPAGYTSTGIATSTMDIHIAFDTILSKNSSTSLNNNATGIWECLRYAPLYITLMRLEKEQTALAIDYTSYLRYCEAYNKYFAKYRRNTQPQSFTNGHSTYDAATCSDIPFLQHIMQMACEEMMHRVEVPMIPCTTLEYELNRQLLANGPADILLSYPTLEW